MSGSRPDLKVVGGAEPSDNTENTNTGKEEIQTAPTQEEILKLKKQKEILDKLNDQIKNRLTTQEPGKEKEKKDHSNEYSQIVISEKDLDKMRTILSQNKITFDENQFNELKSKFKQINQHGGIAAILYTIDTIALELMNDKTATGELKTSNEELQEMLDFITAVYDVAELTNTLYTIKKRGANEGRGALSKRELARIMPPTEMIESKFQRLHDLCIKQSNTFETTVEEVGNLQTASTREHLEKKEIANKKFWRGVKYAALATLVLAATVTLVGLTAGGAAAIIPVAAGTFIAISTLTGLFNATILYNWGLPEGFMTLRPAYFDRKKENKNIDHLKKGASFFKEAKESTSNKSSGEGLSPASSTKGSEASSTGSNNSTSSGTGRDSPELDLSDRHP